MSCETVRRLESEALDRLLPDKVEAQIHAHLASCEACRTRYQQLARMQATLAQMGRVFPPPALDKAVRAIWHPTLRLLPAVRLYPYLKGYITWELGKLRLVGHLAGLLLTAGTFLLTLVSFGHFPLQDARIGGPGIYTYMTRPSLVEPDYPDARDLISDEGLSEGYFHPDLSVGAARLNENTLSRFAAHELEAIHEDSFSVITSMDSGGRGAIEGVLHSPRDQRLVVRFSRLISTSRFDWPGPLASSKGRVVWSFSRIFVTS